MSNFYAIQLTGSSGGGDVNLASVAGTPVDVGHGTTDSGTLRIVTATDSAINISNYPLGQRLMVSSIAVTIASDQTSVPVSGTVDTSGSTVTANAGTGTFSTNEVPSTASNIHSVTAAITSTSLLATNNSRLGAMFFNDSTAILYLKLGLVASTTSYTVQVPPGGYYELPPAHIYVGGIDGIWSAVNGAVRITELS